MFRDVVILPFALYLTLKGLRYADKALELGLHWNGLMTYSDLLCMPVILGSGLWLTRKLTQRPRLMLPDAMIWLTFAAVSLVFEVFLPAHSATYNCRRP